MSKAATQALSAARDIAEKQFIKEIESISKEIVARDSVTSADLDRFAMVKVAIQYIDELGDILKSRPFVPFLAPANKKIDMISYHAVHVKERDEVMVPMSVVRMVLLGVVEEENVG